MMIKAIETSYKGYRFRSRLEARWAVFFDALGIKWEYEKEGFDLGDGLRYLPDFWIPEYKCWVEIKPLDSVADANGLRGYIAGDIASWRDNLDTSPFLETGPTINAKGHDSQRHGNIEHDWDHVLATCLLQISAADWLFAWISSVHCFGTITEIGFAHAKCKPIYIGFEEKIYRRLQRMAKQVSWQEPDKPHEMWFVEKLAKKSGVFNTAQASFDALVPRPHDSIVKASRLSQNGTVSWICWGAPWNDTSWVATFRWNNLTGPPERNVWPSWMVHSPNWHNAVSAARSARFEFGENRQ